MEVALSAIDPEETWKWAPCGIFLGFAAFVKIVIAFGARRELQWCCSPKEDFGNQTSVDNGGLDERPAPHLLCFPESKPLTEYFFAWTITLINLITSTDFYTKWLAFLTLFG